MLAPPGPSLWSRSGHIFFLPLYQPSAPVPRGLHVLHSTHLTGPVCSIDTAIFLSFLKQTFLTGLLGYHCLLSPFASPACPRLACRRCLWVSQGVLLKPLLSSSLVTLNSLHSLTVWHCTSPQTSPLNATLHTQLHTWHLPLERLIGISNLTCTHLNVESSSQISAAFLISINSNSSLSACQKPWDYPRLFLLPSPTSTPSVSFQITPRVRPLPPLLSWTKPPLSLAKIAPLTP